MSIERNTAVDQHHQNAQNASKLNGVSALTIHDVDWTSKVLEQAFYTDQLLNFIYGDTIHQPGKLNSFFRGTFRLAALYGICLGTTGKNGVLMMFPPDQINLSIFKMLKSGVVPTLLKMGLPFSFTDDEVYGLCGKRAQSRNVC